MTFFIIVAAIIMTPVVIFAIVVLRILFGNPTPQNNVASSPPANDNSDFDKDLAETMYWLHLAHIINHDNDDDK